MPNLLLMISGACIVAFVLRETLEDLQKKTSDHDRHHDRSDKRGKSKLKPAVVLLFYHRPKRKSMGNEREKEKTERSDASPRA